MIFTVVFVLTMAASFAALIRAIRKSADGREDDTGFHAESESTPRVSGAASKIIREEPLPRPDAPSGKRPDGE